jgi:hypothetical protein
VACQDWTPVICTAWEGVLCTPVNRTRADACLAARCRDLRSYTQSKTRADCDTTISEQEMKARVTNPTTSVPTSPLWPPNMTLPDLTGGCNSYLPSGQTLQRYAWVVQYCVAQGERGAGNAWVLAMLCVLAGLKAAARRLRCMTLASTPVAVPVPCIPALCFWLLHPPTPPTPPPTCPPTPTPTPHTHTSPPPAPLQACMWWLTSTQWAVRPPSLTT